MSDPRETALGEVALSEVALSEVALSEVRHERDMARAAEARLLREVKRLERRLAESEADRAALANRLEERERYLTAVLGSRPWKLVQRLRALVGRSW